MGACFGKKKAVRQSMTFQYQKDPAKDAAAAAADDADGGGGGDGAADLDAVSRRLSTGKATLNAYSFD